MNERILEKHYQIVWGYYESCENKDEFEKEKIQKVRLLLNAINVIDTVKKVKEIEMNFYSK